jgi:glycine dehydrogenase subunit 2
MSLPIAPKPGIRRFHQARWDEPLVFELSTPGERGVAVPPVERDVRTEVGDVVGALPDGLRRATPPPHPQRGHIRGRKPKQRQ